MLRFLGAQHILEDATVDTYTPTELSLALADPDYHGWIDFL